MTSENYITSYCLIRDNQIFLNGEEVLVTDKLPFQEFAKKAYQYINPNYPKFYKMDNLSKLAFIASELVLKGQLEEGENDIALVFSNKSSSLDTDVNYQQSIADKENYFPSPAVFVYTLPNICMGEVSIRNKLNSENAFFVTDDFNGELIVNYTDLLIKSGKAGKVLCAWIELYRENYKAFFYLVSDKGPLTHNALNVHNLYSKN